MASWSEIERIRKDPDGARILAQRLRASGALTDWEEGFIDSLADRDTRDELSTRQAEKLLQVRDACTFVSTWRGFSVRTLVLRCHEARLDLDENDEAWIATLYATDTRSVRHREAARLMRCARRLSLVDQD